jgi:hypothetical protein
MVFLLQFAAVLAAGLFVALAWTWSPRPAEVAGSLAVVACAYIVLWSHLSQHVDSFRAERIQSRSVQTGPLDFFLTTSSYRVGAVWAAIAFAAVLELVLSARGG